MNSIPIRRRGSRKFPQLNDPAWLATQIRTKSLRQIARELGTDHATIGNQCERHGIEIPVRCPSYTMPQRSQAIRMYRDEFRSSTEIHRELGVSVRQLLIWLRQEGVEIRSNTVGHRIRRNRSSSDLGRRRLHRIREAARLNVEKNWGRRRIALNLRVGETTVQKLEATAYYWAYKTFALKIGTWDRAEAAVSMQREGVSIEDIAEVLGWSVIQVRDVVTGQSTEAVMWTPPRRRQGGKRAGPLVEPITMRERTTTNDETNQQEESCQRPV